MSFLKTRTSAEAFDEGGGAFGGGAGVEWWLRVVLDHQLDRLGRGRSGDPAGKLEGHVDAGRYPGRRHVLPVNDHALVGSIRAEVLQPAEGEQAR